MKIALDRLADSAKISGAVTTFIFWFTLSAWWHVPGKFVLIGTILLFLALTLLTYAGLLIIEHILVHAAKIKKASDRGYISRRVICEIARGRNDA